MSKQVSVRVIAPDSELEYTITNSTTGKQLYEKVASIVGLREIWYFGITFFNSKGTMEWLKLNKKVVQQNVKKDKPLNFRLKIKFYPESVQDDLIQEITLKYFFIEIKSAILSDVIYCSADTCVLLASYALQAKYGDFENESNVKEDEKILPERVLGQYSLTKDEWKAKIVTFWKEHRDMLNIEAITEYLKIAQDLEMYGVSYFDIKNKKGTQLYLGVDALGVNIYETDNKLNPKIGFPWSEIRNISYNDKKFILKATDKRAPDFTFYTDNTQTNKRILALCMGNHDHYMRRHRPETMELQQMRSQAKIEKEGKLFEKRQSVRSREQKEASERKAAETEERLRKAEEHMRQMEEEMRREKEAKERLDNEVYIMKSQVAEKEENVRLLESHAAQVKEDMARLREEYEYKSAEEQEAIKVDMNKLKEENDRLEQKIHLVNIEHQREKEQYFSNYESLVKQHEAASKNRERVAEEEIEQGSANMAHSGNIEGDRAEEDRQGYLGANKTKAEQLALLRSELQVNYKTDTATNLDIINMDNILHNRDKFKTLKQIRQGNTKQRVEQFESN